MTYKTLDLKTAAAIATAQDMILKDNHGAGRTLKITGLVVLSPKPDDVANAAYVCPIVADHMSMNMLEADGSISRSSVGGTLNLRNNELLDEIADYNANELATGWISAYWTPSLGFVTVQRPSYLGAQEESVMTVTTIEQAIACITKITDADINAGRDQKAWGFVTFALRFNELADEGKIIPEVVSTDRSYFGNLVDATIEGLNAFGDQVVFADKYNRQVIVTKTRLGNVVLFRRYAPSEPSKAITHNLPYAVSRFVPSGNLAGNEDAVVMIVGSKCQENVGQMLESLRADLN